LGTVRQPAVAGSFYPAHPAELTRAVDRLLEAARIRLPGEWLGPMPKALVVPHAGYLYSGSVAALGYARISMQDNAIRRVVLIGPAHFVPLAGLALPEASALATPLGEVPVDTDSLSAVAGLAQVTSSRSAHAPEHSLEVQLPFLQRVLGDFCVSPLVVGDAGPAEVAPVLDALWGGPETLVVVSSDLSHYLPYASAQDADLQTMEQIIGLAGPLDVHQACGARAVNGLLSLAAGRRLQPTLLGMANSGDTAGDKRRVVGYAAVAFAEQAAAGAREGSR
jgi:AmmeMemoRadiSam system protein B